MWQRSNVSELESLTFFMLQRSNVSSIIIITFIKIQRACKIKYEWVIKYEFPLYMP